MTPTLASLLVPVAHALGVRIVCDQSELPEVHAGAGVLGRVRLAVRVWGMRHSDAVIAINPAIVARVTPMVSPAEVHYLPVIIDCDDYTGDLAPSARSEIVYTGPLNNVKDGVDVLLDAFALVKAAIPDCWLVLLGDDDRSRVDRARSHARSLGVEDRVEFRGAVPRPELLAAVARATVLVLPRPDTEQNRSNMPTKLVEYLASGRPVVATTVGLTPAMVDNGSAAVLVAPGDAEALAKGLIGVLSDPDAAAAMGTRGRLRALSTYDFRQYSSMLHTLATGTPRKADRP
jgi:glycosyltransferase involved in cell wall biosynthesis